MYNVYTIYIINYNVVKNKHKYTYKLHLYQSRREY